jgi:hypothetical protein
MPEDAPGNPGAMPARPPAAARIGTVREMQAKLHRWAGQDRSRRFGDLFNLVYDPDFLAEAWLRVAGNAGARTPGIDAATVADAGLHLPEANPSWPEEIRKKCEESVRFALPLVIQNRLMSAHAEMKKAWELA